MMTKQEAEQQFSRPIRHGDGYVIDEYRPGANAAFRANQMTYRDAMTYRREMIRQLAEA